jgi:predicted dehydrogenase
MTIGIAVVGLGRWGPNHVRNFLSVKGCRVVGAADTVQATRDRIHALYPDVECVDDFRKLLAREDVNAVVVATPTATHHEIVRDALNAGKHVLCEKPLTSLSAPAWELVNLAAAKNVKLMVGHVFLFNPGIEYLIKAVRDGAAGPIYYLSSIRTNLGPFRSDVNAAWDLASHDVYIFNHILGRRPVSVSAVGASYLRKPVEDIVFLTLKYADGILGHVHVSWLDPKKVREITLVGEKKMITWDEFGVPGPIMIYDRTVVRDPVYNTFGEFQLLAREGDVSMPRIPPQEPLSAQARAFADLVAGGSAAAGKGTAREGAEVVDVLAAAAASIARGGAEQEVRYGG